MFGGGAVYYRICITLPVEMISDVVRFARLLTRIKRSMLFLPRGSIIANVLFVNNFSILWRIILSFYGGKVGKVTNCVG